MSRPEKDKLAVELFLPGMTVANEQAMRKAGFLLLDNTLGEFDVETYLGGIEFRLLSEARDKRMRPLSELVPLIDALKPKTP